MKNAKLNVIISVVLAVVLFACAFIFKFTRDVQAGWTNVYSVEFNDNFNASDVEKIMKEAGAKNCLVQKVVSLKDAYTTLDQTSAVIYFSADDSQAVFDKAEELLSEKYFLKYDGTLNTVSATMNYKTIVDYLPLLIILAVLAVYVFVRFGFAGGVLTLIDGAVASLATIGIISIAHITVGDYTIPACVAAASLAFALSIAFNLIKKNSDKRISGKENALNTSIKEMNVLSVIVCAIAIVALVLVLIFGGVITKAFAITSIIGTVVNAAVALFTMPAVAKLFCKVN